MMNLPDYIELHLLRMQCSLRELAANLCIDAGYLSRLRSGEKTEPSEEVLRKLGLRRVVYYVRATDESAP
jgi:transcriptional regulator with XRE-family HTH domain